MFQEVYRNSRWRPLVFLDRLVFFCPVPVVTVVVRLSAFLRLISLFALRVFRASLCRAKRLPLSYEKVMQVISHFVLSK